MQFLSLNFGDEKCASSLFRIHAFKEALWTFGLSLHCVEADGSSDWRALADFDGVIVQKKLFSCGRVWAVRKNARRLIYDIDDAIWHLAKGAHHWITTVPNNFRLKAIVSAADLCLSANATIGEHLRPWARKLEIFPMSLDESIWRSIPKRDSGIICIGWSGAPGNLCHLEAMEPVLSDLLRTWPNVQLVVMSGVRPKLAIPYDYIEWRFKNCLFPALFYLRIACPRISC